MKPGNTKTLGPLLLSGLMIGPILGSGIIVLPPLAYSVAGDWAIFAWALMALAGFAFAFIFARLTTLFPGSGGATNAVEAAFGTATKRLTSFYLIGAVLFGPVAVMLTAADYLFPGNRMSSLIALPMLLTCSCLLLRQIKSIGRFSLLMSSLAAAILVAGGLTTLFWHQKPATPLPSFHAGDFGYSLLLLFWTPKPWWHWPTVFLSPTPSLASLPPANFSQILCSVWLRRCWVFSSPSYFSTHISLSSCSS